MGVEQLLARSVQSVCSCVGMLVSLSGIRVRFGGKGVLFCLPVCLPLTHAVPPR